jgi:hypothetical protein
VSETIDGFKQPDFTPILELIRQVRSRTLRSINYELIDLYWQIGKYLSQKIASDGWGQATAKELAKWLKSQESDVRGFSSQNLWRMRQSYEIYSANEKLSPVVRELP